MQKKVRERGTALETQPSCSLFFSVYFSLVPVSQEKIQWRQVGGGGARRGRPKNRWWKPGSCSALGHLIMVSFPDFIHRCTVFSPAFEVSPSNSRPLDHRKPQRKATSPRCFLSGPGSCISHAGSYQSSELRHRTKVPSFLRKSGPPTETAWECLEMHSRNTITLELCQPRDTLSVPAAFRRRPSQMPQKMPLPGMATTSKKCWT